MATQLERPGVEVVQEFVSASPTVVTPQLVPCVVAPYFEVIEVLDSDGTANADALMASSYDQLFLEIDQSSFPSPRDNIDEVNVLEDTVRAFMLWGGSLVEAMRDEGFLLALNLATQASVVGTVDGVSGFTDMDTRTFKFQVDSHTSTAPAAADLPASADYTVTFDGASLTIDEVVEQINAQSVSGLASVDGTSPKYVKITSPSNGAGSSVAVKYDGTANVKFGFDFAVGEVAVGGGFYAVDDADGDLVSARVELYSGTDQRLINASDTGNPVNPSSYDFVALKIEAGDGVYADGVNIGEIDEVSATRLTMEVEQNIFGHGSPFHPRYFWFQAKSLSYPAPAASIQGTVTGDAAVAAVAPYIVGASAFSAVTDGESLTLAGAEDGVALTDEVLVASSWSSLSAAVSAINTAATNFEAYASNSVGDEVAAGTYLGLRTIATIVGSGSSILLSNGTADALTNTGFSVNDADVGENIRYRAGTPAFAVGAATFASIQPLVSTETVIYTPEYLGAATVPSSETIVWAGNHATVAAAIADWNSQALFTEAYEADSAGVETTAGGYFAVRTLGENAGLTAEIDITATDSKTVLTIATYNGTDVTVNGSTFKWSVDTNPKEYLITLVEDEDDSGLSLQQVINKINELVPGIAAAGSSSPPELVLTSNKEGRASEIEVLDGTANIFLGFTDSTAHLGAGRPAPDLALDVSGNAILQGQILRDGLTGIPFSNGSAPMYFSYKGLRLDLSPEADNPSLIVWDSTEDITNVAPPISLDNIGSLMSYLAKLNAPTSQVASIGVPAVSDDAPDGTPAGYTTALEFLQSEEVYAVAPASQNPVVHQAGLAHVNAMSASEQKGERILIFNPEVPDRENPTSVESGTDANSTGTDNEVTLETNIASALIALGINPNLDINPATGAIENEVYLDLGSDDQAYLIKSVTSGTDLVLRTTFATGDGNSDSFYSTMTLTGSLISDDWSVFIRGDLLEVGGVLDKSAVSETVQGAASAYGDRRGYYVFPDTVKIDLSGLEQQAEGYYACAAIAGMIGQLPPQQPFTNYPITGLTGIVGSDDTYTNSQLNVMAAGGVYILVQDVEGAPVTSRHQLSTDTSSIEKRELSITKIVDYVAKFIRSSLRTFIGRNNITPEFIDQIGIIIQGLLTFLEDNNVVIGAELDSLAQDENNPDTLVASIVLDVPYPCNYIRLLLLV